MWYFAWILGIGVALAFGVINAMWFEILDLERERTGNTPPAAPADPPERERG